MTSHKITPTDVGEKAKKSHDVPGAQIIIHFPALSVKYPSTSLSVYEDLDAVSELRDLIADEIRTYGFSGWLDEWYMYDEIWETIYESGWEVEVVEVIVQEET